jgi:hypothetical protein
MLVPIGTSSDKRNTLKNVSFFKALAKVTNQILSIQIRGAQEYLGIKWIRLFKIIFFFIQMIPDMPIY